MTVRELTDEILSWMDALSQPLWVFTPETLAIVSANDAICVWLGYSRDELQSKTIADVRPVEDREAIRELVANFTGDTLDAGRWAIITGSGVTVYGRFQWHRAKLAGKSVILATVTDETKLESLAEETNLLQERINDANERKELAVEEFTSLFEASPCKMLALKPGTFEIAAVTDAYLDATMTRRADIRGHLLFDIFPDNPDEPDSDATKSLRASLRRVEALRQPDFMGIQRYPIKRPNGEFEIRYWVPLNQPVFGPDARLIYIIHRVDDVTDLFEAGFFDNTGESDYEKGKEEIYSAASLTQEMRQALSRIDENEARLRTAERLMELGQWEYDFNTAQTSWSDETFEIYGLSKNRTAPSFDEYVALVHPEDRQKMVETYTKFFERGASQIHFAHRIIRDDGSVRHIHGVGERYNALHGEIVVGFVQDVTPYVELQQNLSRAQDLIRIAGEKARVGGWQVDLSGPTVYWSDETAIIHGVTLGFQPSLEEAINFYVEDDREKVATAVSALIQEGSPIDFQARIRATDGNVRWVRAMGEPVRDQNENIIAIRGAFQDIDDLVEARSHAQQAQEELVSTLEHIGDAFFTVDENWRFKYVNLLAENLLRRSREELVGQEIWEIFPEVIGTTFEREYKNAVETRTIARFKEYFDPLDLWVEVNAYPVPGGLAVYFRDIGNKRKQEERLALLETAVSRMNDVLMITEAEPLDAPDGPKIIYVNEAFQRRTGYSPEEVIGQTPRMLQGPDTDLEETKRIGSLLRKWQPVRSELINYTKTGEPFWLDLDIVPIMDDTGWYTHFVALERDITGSKESQEKEKRSQEMFRLVSQVTSDFVWEYDVSNDRWLRNDRHLKMLGLSHDQDALSLNETVKIIHEEDRQGFVESFLAALEGSDVSWEFEYRITDGDGRIRFVENQAAIVRDKDGRATRVVGGLTDVTEVRELDRQFREAQKMEAIGQLTGGVAHDFNNLLTVILGNAEELSDRLSEDDKLRILAEMTATAAERGAELTSRLLAFARRQTLEPKRLDLNRQLHSMDSLLRRTLPETISIEFVRGGGLWQVELDPAQLESAILNLAINARDSMPQGGNLTVETANAHLDQEYADQHEDVSPGQYVMVSVTDTGCGMDEWTQLQAFEPFFTTKSVGEGTGLGLSMVFGFTKQSNGHIKVYSEIGEGTTVKLYFPRASSADVNVKSEIDGSVMMGGTETVLVVEDEDLVREHLERQLIELGYTVITAENGKEALDKVQEYGEQIDLLLTDVIMPGGLNGREVAERAVEWTPNLKVLYTSGYTENSVVHQGRLKRGVHMLSKPYRRQALARKVREVLDE